jgi:PAS domain S-box-containing protein
MSRQGMGDPGTADVARLLDAAEILWSVLEASDDAVFTVDHEGTVTSWNPAATLIFGRGPADALGAAALDLFPPGLRDEERETLARVLRGHRIDHRVTELRRPDGYVAVLSMTLTPRHDPAGDVVGATIVAREITESVEAQANLAELREQMREAEVLARFGMWSLDRATGAVQWSEGMHEIFALSPERAPAVLDDFLALLPAARDELADAVRACLETGASFSVEAEAQRPDGRARFLLIRGNVVRSPSGVRLGVRGTCSDLTERHAVERAIREAYEHEARAAQELRRADDMKDAFLATVSHELRTPLAIIFGLAAELADQAPDDAVRAAVERIAANASAMRSMIDRLLDFGRLQAGEVAFEPEPVRLRQAVEELVTALTPALRAHDVVVDLAPDVVVSADPLSLERIVGNLLTNAARYSPDGSTITIQAEVHEPGGEASREGAGGAITVSVVDEGPGVPVQHRDRIFERFVQLDPGRTGRRGAGVGLAIVRADVERHGGRTWVEDAPGGGAAFRFTLPRAEPHS